MPRQISYKTFVVCPIPPKYSVSDLISVGPEDRPLDRVGLHGLNPGNGVEEMDKATRNILRHYRNRTIAAFVLASGASFVLVMSYLLGVL